MKLKHCFENNHNSVKGQRHSTCIHLKNNEQRRIKYIILTFSSLQHQETFSFTRLIHRNLRMQCESLPISQPAMSDFTKHDKKGNKLTKVPQKDVYIETHKSESESESDAEEPISEIRAKRVQKIRKQFTYDTLGNPSINMMTTYQSKLNPQCEPWFPAYYEHSYSPHGGCMLQPTMLF